MRIEAARRRAGLTQKALAERLGVRLWILELLEQDQLDPAPYLEALASVTGEAELLQANDQLAGENGGEPEPEASAGAPAARDIGHLRAALARTEAENVRLQERMEEARKRLEESEGREGRIDALLDELRAKEAWAPGRNRFAGHPEADRTPAGSEPQRLRDDVALDL